MRVSHRQLEVCRANPSAWLRARINPQGGPRWGYDRAITVAIYRYHAHSDAAAARLYLRDLLDRLNLKTATRVKNAEDQLLAYIEWHGQAGVVVADQRVRISLDLGSEVILGGEVSRVDLDVKTGGYRGILLGEPSPDWSSELRMPLLQRALAQRYQRVEAEVSVGVQHLDGAGLTTRRFEGSRLDEAGTEARAFARKLARLGRAMGLT